MKSEASEQDKLDLPNCVSCEKHILVAFCPECEGMVCGDCKNAHITVKQLREERPVTLFGDLKPKQINAYITNQQRRFEKCHQKYKLDCYCQTCLKPNCQMCSNTDHTSHKRLSIEAKAEEIKQLIQQDLDRVNQQKQRFLQELELSKQNIRRFGDEISTAKRKVIDQVQAQIKML